MALTAAAMSRPGLAPGPGRPGPVGAGLGSGRGSGVRPGEPEVEGDQRGAQGQTRPGDGWVRGKGVPSSGLQGQMQELAKGLAGHQGPDGGQNDAEDQDDGEGQKGGGQEGGSVGGWVGCGWMPRARQMRISGSAGVSCRSCEQG